MASSARSVQAVEEIARELDLVVYRLEREKPSADWADEKRKLRRELEGLRDRLEDAARDLGF